MQRGIWTRILRKWVFGTTTSPERKRRAKRSSLALRASSASSGLRVRPQLEALEDRTLLNAYVVNLTGDGNPGDVAGVQSGPLSGNLRWCINQADVAANAGSTITFDQTVFNPLQPTTITLLNGELPISNSMTITNPGGPGTITVSGDASGKLPQYGVDKASRIFDIIPSAVTVAITGLTITGGNANVINTASSGNQGGDIFNGGNLTLNNDIVQNGYSAGITGGPPGRGGGIFNAEGQNGGPGAKLTLNNTIVQNNEAKGWEVFSSGNAAFNGGIGGAGGGIFNDANASVIVQGGSKILNNTAQGNSVQDINSTATSFQFQKYDAPGGLGQGGGIYNNTGGSLSIVGGGSSAPIVVEGNVAQGGQGGYLVQGPISPGNPPLVVKGLSGGDAYGGGVYNAGSITTMQYVNFLGNQALGGLGGTNLAVGNVTAGILNGVPARNGYPSSPDGKNAGNGGSAQGGGIYNASSVPLSIPNSVFDVDANPANRNGATSSKGGLLSTGNIAVAGNGGDGGDGLSNAPGGNGGDGGSARGGAVASTRGGGLAFKSTSFTSSQALAGAGGVGGNGGNGTNAGNGANGGDAGDAYGGAVFNSSGSLALSTGTFTASKAVGGAGGAGGAAGNGADGLGGAGGFGGAGGVGGGAQGGAFYNANAALTIGSIAFNDSEAIGGNGGNGGNGGRGGQGSDGPSGGLGGAAGLGGNGGDTRRASGGTGEDLNGDATISATFTSSMVQSGNGGAGGNGGQGGNSGNGTTFPANGLYGGAGGDGGAGGSAGPALGGALAISSSTLTINSNSTFSGSSVVGGSGGAGGIGGGIGSFGHLSGDIPSSVYVLNYTQPPQVGEGTVNLAGNGGAGGAGAVVSGGAVSVTSAPPPGVNVISKYEGLNFGQSNSNQRINPLTPNAQGAAGSNTYVEATNQAVAIFNPNTTGTLLATDSLPDFFTNVGNLPRAFFGQFMDPAVVWDDQIQRFIIVDLDVDGSFNNPNITQHKSFLDIAVSKSTDPATLTAADWNFYQVSTTESQNGATFDPQDTGNIGWNHDALVVTLNMYNQFGVENHVQVNTISINALLNGTALSEGSNAFQYDYSGADLRPTVMHDSNATDPMWFVQAGTNLNSQGQYHQINVVEMTNPLTSTAAFTSTLLGVNAYSSAVPMLQPTAASNLGVNQLTGVNSSIQKVAEYNGLLATAQTVSDTAGDEDSIQWYVIDISKGVPTLQQEGDLGGGTHIYDAFPSIDINKNGDLGMTYSQSGEESDQFLSMYVAGRAATDAVGTMRTPVLVQPGLQDYHGDLLGINNPVGPVSGINVASDGSFWAVNQFADLETFTNWSTAIAHFAIPTSKSRPQTVSINQTTFTNSAITAGNGGAGGAAGLGSDDGKNRGINGQGANGGLAQGGTVFLSASTAQSATLNKVTITSSTATAGAGGAGAINNVGGIIVTAYYTPAYGSNGSFSTAASRLAGLSGRSSNGGDGGSVEGVGIDAGDYSLDFSSTSLTGGIGTAGSGGIGGSASSTFPNGWDGGNGGAGGSVQGGGVYLNNSFQQAQLDPPAAPALVAGNNGGSWTVQKVWVRITYVNSLGETVGSALSSVIVPANGVLTINSPAAAGGGPSAATGWYAYVGVGATQPANTALYRQQTGAPTAIGTNLILNANPTTTGANPPTGNVNFTFNGGSASNYTLKAGNGGNGGNAGASATANRLNNVAGGAGGAGGSVQGGGIYAFAGSNSFNTLILGNISLLNNQISAGTGGVGGAGYNAFGGAGGSAQGGGIFSTSLNRGGGQTSSLSITASTLAGDDATGGNGGNAGSGTTPNGGAGGAGGSAGNADGGGLFNGENTSLIVTNSTFGGGSTSTTNANANANILTSGVGGNGGNAGTPGGVTKNDGGAGGAGGSVAGGNVYNASQDASIMGDTLVYGQASIFGLGGIGGSGAGTGGQPGAAGSNGTGLAGGYFATSGSSNNIGNTILALNSAAAPLPTPAAPTLEAGISGGSWKAQTAWVLITYVNSIGETVGSAVTSVSVPPNGTLTIDSPAAVTGAIGWYAYIGIGTTQPANTALYRQQAAGSPTPIGTNLTLTANPTTTGANPPTSNTTASPDAFGNFSSAGSNLLSSTPGAQPPAPAAPTLVAGNSGGSWSSQTAWVRITYVNSTGETTSSAVTSVLVLGTGTLTIDSPAAQAGAIGWYAYVGVGTTQPANTALYRQQAAGSPTPIGTNLTLTANPTTTGANPPTAFNNLPTGFNTDPTSGGTDQIVTASTLNIGPLLDNGGPTPTDALLPGSVAISAGNVGLIPTGITTDQRGEGFSRTFTVNNIPTLSVGAFEYLPPVINDSNSLSPNSVVEGSPAITLTVNGSNFATGATVSFGSNPTALTPLPGSSSTQLIVTVPASLLTTPGTVQVYVNVPDGSGKPGSVEKSAPVNFTILATPFTLNNPGNQKGYIGGTASLQIAPAAGFTANSFSATGLPPGLTIDSSGLISGTIDDTASTTNAYNVTVTAKDSKGDSTNITFSWSISPPLVLNNPGNQISDEGAVVGLQITAPPGYTPSGFTASGLPPGLSIDPTTGLISGTIGLYAAGTYPQVTILPANNGGKGGVTFTWTVLSTTPPTLTNPGDQTSAVGQNIYLPIQATNATSGSFTVQGLPPGLNIDANGVIYGTIKATDQGRYAVTIQAANGTILSAPVSFFWTVSGSLLPSPSSPPASPPGSAPIGVTGLGTTTTIVNVSNQYVGLVQLETITVDVTSGSGYIVNEGSVAIQVDGQTVLATVHNGVAKATVATGLLNLDLWMELLFSHSLTAGYSDNGGAFASSSAGTVLPAIWIDYFMSLLALNFGQLNQLQN